jgi:hypothetical protein
MKLHNVFVLFGKVLVVVLLFKWFATPGKALENQQNLKIETDVKLEKP